jgi:hypothetical protein
MVVVVASWENQEAVEAFSPTVQELRASASERAGLRFSPPDRYPMIRTTVRLD